MPVRAYGNVPLAGCIFYKGVNLLFIDKINKKAKKQPTKNKPREEQKPKAKKTFRSNRHHNS